MKHIILGMALVLFVGMFEGCGGGSSTPTPGPGGNPVPPGQSALLLRTKTGDINITSSAVSSLQIQILPNIQDPTSQQVQRTFYGQYVAPLITDLGFATESDVDTTQMEWTGMVFLTYVSPSDGTTQTKEFDVYNGSVLSDVDFQNLTYVGNVIMSDAWLVAQPGGQK